MKLNVFLPAGLSIMMIMASCNGKKENDSEKTSIDPESTQIIKVNNQIFSIPSPIQSSLLIKKCGVAYNKAILNNPDNAEKYATDFSKALNLGIYGGDLGYAATYEQKKDINNYMKSAKTLSEGLNITNAFDMHTIERLERNLGNKDSMLAMIGDIYSMTNSYLKNNEQADISSLILVGGWIESMYLTAEIYQLSKNEDLKQRIAEQKPSLERVINLLRPYRQKDGFTDLFNDINTLTAVYDSISFNNSYVQATTDSKNKTTVINSQTEVSITDVQIADISAKIKALRKKIIE